MNYLRAGYFKARYFTPLYGNVDEVNPPTIENGGIKIGYDKKDRIERNNRKWITFMKAYAEYNKIQL
jgi:hypothetical protein